MLDLPIREALRFDTCTRTHSARRMPEVRHDRNVASVRDSLHRKLLGLIWHRLISGFNPRCVIKISANERSYEISRLRNFMGTRSVSPSLFSAIERLAGAVNANLS
jgi:hypothetical protein